MSDTLMNYDMPQIIAENQELHLTQEELKEVDACFNAIDLSDSSSIVDYGSELQKEFSALYKRIQSTLNAQGVADIETVLHTTTQYLRYITDEKNNISFFKRTKALSVREKCKEAEKHVNKVTDTLQQHQIQLMKDCALLAQMYYMNTVYFRDLNVKIAAGRKKLDYCQQTELPSLQKKTKETGHVQDAQTITDLKNQMNQFEKKLHELALTRNISFQTASLIKLIRADQTATAEKIQSILLHTIPLWRKQVILALETKPSGQATLDAPATVTTLDDINKQLIESLDEVARMQQKIKQQK